ncbi:LOW QUALITY PROTEIN: arf-GAP domain and FG repeat-containing protein 2 [Passer domesticus]|uniref:LOW QUALITY PROTEIN: arf-GAP domain and FG repeat-containing protein 2 n=1 Tax=Passer domesticus TaxID=48849 RepID=UPI0030FE422F
MRRFPLRAAESPQGAGRGARGTPGGAARRARPISGGAAAAGAGPAGAGRWRRAAAAAAPGPAEAPGPAGAARAGTAEAEVWCRRVRELVSAVPANRLCFECGQRGVTYVDISVGSLVCTGCSGALRGLNPPHRVKSISMTTFSEAEVLFLQARGNEACRRVWLGTLDPRASLLPDCRDAQRLKEFLREKYERKRWYVAPEPAKEQVKPPPERRSRAGAPPAPSTGTPGRWHRWERAPLQGCPGVWHPLTLPRAPPRATPSPARPAPTCWLTSGGTPSHFGRLRQQRWSTPVWGGLCPPTTTGGVAAQGVATPTGGGASARYCPSPHTFPALQDPPLPPHGCPSPCSLFGTLRDPPALPHGGYTNPFTAPVAPRPSTNPFESSGPGVAFTSPPIPGGFPSPFQADGWPFGGFGVAKASTNPFVTVPAPTAPLGIRHRATNPFL